MKRILLVSTEYSASINPGLVDWAQQLRDALAPLGWDTNARMLYGDAFGVWSPDSGTMFTNLNNPAFLATHLAKVDVDLGNLIPDATFSGLIVIDYQGWGPEAAAGDPAMLAKVKAYFQQTIELVRLRRPNAFVTYYNYPYSWESIAYAGPDAAYYRDINDDNQWLFDTMDRIVVAPYWWKRRQQAPHAPAYQWLPEEHRSYFTSTLAEAERIGSKRPNQKPVYAGVTYRYSTSHPENTAYLVSGTEVGEFASAAVTEGIEGVVVWGHIGNQIAYDTLLRWITEKMDPALVSAGAVRTTGFAMRLAAVNRMLLDAGIMEVSTLDRGGNSEAGRVERILDRVELECHGHRWNHNTRENVTIAALSDGSVPVPPFTIHIGSADCEVLQLAQIGSHLVDVATDSGDIDASVRCNIVFRVAFECTPRHVAQWIESRASAVYYGTRAGQPGYSAVHHTALWARAESDFIEAKINENWITKPNLQKSEHYRVMSGQSEAPWLERAGAI